MTMVLSMIHPYLIVNTEATFSYSFLHPEKKHFFQLMLFWSDHSVYTVYLGIDPAPSRYCYGNCNAGQKALCTKVKPLKYCQRPPLTWHSNSGKETRTLEEVGLNLYLEKRRGSLKRRRSPENTLWGKNVCFLSNFLPPLCPRWVRALPSDLSHFSLQKIVIFLHSMSLFPSKRTGCVTIPMR